MDCVLDFSREKNVLSNGFRWTAVSFFCDILPGALFEAVAQNRILCNKKNCHVVFYVSLFGHINKTDCVAKNHSLP